MTFSRLSAWQMFLAALSIASLAASVTGAQPEETPLQLAEPFRTEYSGPQATGEHVIALWQFNQPEPAADSSGNEHELSVRGAEFVEGGRFGGALRSYRGWPVEDKPHQARAKRHPSLSPSGPFTIEMWIQPAEELRGYPDAFLVDKKYVSDDDYQLVLMRESASDMRQLRMSLGFGDESASWQSDLLHVPPGVWRHIAFTYDGAGTGAFFVDGSPAGSDRKPGFGRISPGRLDLVLGDRVGSYYHGFPGLIDQVRIARGVLRFTPIEFQLLSPRRVFERMEQAEPLRFSVRNLTVQPLSGARASFVLRGAGRQTAVLPEIASGQQHVLEYRFDTALRPDKYQLTASVEVPGDDPFSANDTLELVLVSRQPAHRMPVVMWGGTNGRRGELREIGFTHTIGVGCDFRAVWDAQGPAQPGDDARIAEGIASLDAALADGMRIVTSLSPGSWARGQTEYQRIGRDGKPYSNRSDV